MALNGGDAVAPAWEHRGRASSISLISNLLQVLFIYLRRSRLEDRHLRSLHRQGRSTAKDTRGEFSPTNT